ncbi:MAG: hypothetical protein H7259_09005 [Cytophagales bacterium]|nr:hypothetical protein [Cytophaga sp.]
MKVFFIALFIWSYSLGMAQTDNSKIVAIRKTVEQINHTKGYTIKTLEGEQFLQQTTDRGGTLTGYFKNGVLVKIVESIGLSSCIILTEYYFQKESLVFAYTQGKEFKYVDSLAGFDRNIPELKMECRYYFYKEVLIQSITSGFTRCSGDPVPKSVQISKDDSTRYAALLKEK